MAEQQGLNVVLSRFCRGLSFIHRSLVVTLVSTCLEQRDREIIQSVAALLVSAARRNAMSIDPYVVLVRGSSWYVDGHIRQPGTTKQEQE